VFHEGTMPEREKKLLSGSGRKSGQARCRFIKHTGIVYLTSTAIRETLRHKGNSQCPFCPRRTFTTRPQPLPG
jgi:hypothetical protein